MEIHLLKDLGQAGFDPSTSRSRGKWSTAAPQPLPNQYSETALAKEIFSSGKNLVGWGKVFERGDYK